MHLILLILGSVLLHNAHSLRCYECIPRGSAACTDTQKDCPGSTQCGATTMMTKTGSVVTDMNMKLCLTAEQCTKASVNYGITAVYINTKCCHTDLCNSASGPAFGAISTAANGKKCYTCIGADCTNELSCTGDEDSCISFTVDAGGKKMKMKGCASKSVCAKDGFASQASTGISVDITCCDGNLCNGAKQASLSLLVLLTSALSVTLLH